MLKRVDAANEAPAAKVKLALNFPDFGSLTVVLHCESRDLYRFLEARGAVKRLRQLDHLGLLRDVYGTLHHSRWEYVFLQLHLVELFHGVSSAFGLGTGVDLPGGLRVSSVRELLQCWAILLNWAHLYGTFEAERVWFKLLTRDDQMREVFERGLPSDEARKRFHEVMAEERIMSLYPLLGSFVLNVHHRPRWRKKQPVDLWLAALDGWYVEPESGSSLWRAQNIMDRVRLMSHALLDTAFSHSFLRVHGAQFFQRVADQAEETLYDEDARVIQAAHAIEAHLSAEVYDSVDAATAKRNYYESQVSQVERLVSRRGTDCLSRGKRVLAERLINHQTQDFGRSRLDTPWRHFLRVRLTPNEPFNRPECRALSEEDSLQKLVRFDHVSFLVSPLLHRQYEASILDVFNRGPLSAREHSRVVWAIGKYLSTTFGGWSFEPSLKCFVMNRAVIDLARHVIELFYGQSFRVRLPDTGSPVDDCAAALVESVPSLRAFRRFLRPQIANAELSKPRKWELDALRQYLAGERSGQYILLLAPLELYDADWRRVAELDGVAFRLGKASLEMIVVEAKKRRSGSASLSLKDLKAKLGKLDLLSYIKPWALQKRKSGYAYARVLLRDDLLTKR